MKTTLLAVSLALIAVARAAALEPGQAAPDFVAADQDGKPRALSQAKGKFVVLEWFNAGCPFVRKHYDSKNMQSLQKKYVGKGVVWYSIASSRQGKQGYIAPDAAVAARKAEGMPSTLLLDPNGEVGRLYGAKNTPHMFVIDPKGVLIYMGAIDDQPSTAPEDLKDSRNYVAAALDEALAGKKVSTPVTKPYGCSVKY